MSVLALALALALSAAPAPPASGFAGEWATTYGDMTLSESGGSVTGHYLFAGAECPIKGRVDDGELVFTYREPTVTGEGRFRLSPDGRSFEGRWRPKGGEGWSPWLGRRRSRPESPDFQGAWMTTFGAMRLAPAGDGLAGLYAFADGELEGKLQDGVFRFRYRDVRPGDGEFRMGEDGASFSGRWRADGDEQWREWIGTRLEPVPGRRWLVVLESNWETSLAEKEYSYGEMLKTFFSRAPNVEVRRRPFTDKQSLLRWVREAALLAEPVVLYLSGHGGEDGLATGSGPLGAEELAAALRPAANVQLVHFGACDVMKGPFPRELRRRLAPRRVALSGFAQSVDWAASAVTDFMYLELLLARDLPPRRAAAELVRLMPFAARASGKAGYDGVSFRFAAPEER